MAASLKIALTASVALLSLTACADMRTAKILQQRGDYAGATRHYQELSDFGLPEAQVEMALMHTKSDAAIKGFAGDLPKAVALLRAADEAGMPRASYELGRLYVKGGKSPAGNLKPDLAAAERYFNRADKLRYDPARVAYGRGLLAVSRHQPDAAFDYFKSSMDGGYDNSALEIARMLEKGKIVKKDPVKSLAYYYKARSMGNENAEKIIQRLEAQYPKGTIDQARILSERL